MIVQSNKGDSIILFEYLNDRTVVNLINPTVKSNEVFRGSTLFATTSKDFEDTGYAYSKVTSANNLIHFQVNQGIFSDNFVAETAD